MPRKKSSRSYFGHIEYVREGVYRIHWGRGRDSTGKRNKNSLTIHGTREAAEIELAKHAGQRYKNVTNETWSEFWKSTVRPTFDNLAERTKTEYEYYWQKHLEPRIGHMRVCDTDFRLADSVLSGIKSPYNQRHSMAIWRKACNLAVRYGLLEVCPIDARTPLKPIRKKPKALLEREDLAEWMKAIQGIKYEAPLLFGLGAGLRPEEACALHWEDIKTINIDGKSYVAATIDKAITLNRGQKVLKVTKNESSEREIILCEPFASRILELKKDQEGPILPSGNNETGAEAYSGPAVMSRNYKRWCEHNGVNYIPPKNLRSTFATWHGEAGSPDSLVDGAMGHTARSTRARHYQSITRRALAFIADNLESWIKKGM